MTTMHLPRVILTDRLELRRGDAALFAVPFDDRDGLARALGATVPESWPVENYDQPMLDYCAAAAANDPDAGMLRYMIERATNTLIGTFGDGLHGERTLRIGYSVLPEWRRRGYTTEALRAVIAEARKSGAYDRLTADTFPHLDPSIGVLKKCGFHLAGPGEEEGTITFVLAL
jgi:ribosomal-protein-alanine N-acetyltransferase